MLPSSEQVLKFTTGTDTGTGTDTDTDTDINTDEVLLYYLEVCSLLPS